MNKIFHCFLFILLIYVGGYAQASTQSFTTSEGFQIEVRLKVEKEVIMFAETTFILFEVKNNSQHELRIGVGGDYRNNLGRPESYKVSVVRDDGKNVPQPQITYGGGGFVGGAPIPANGSYIRKLYLPHWATFENTGTYQITVEKSLGIANWKTDTHNSFPAKVSAKIEIIPTDDKKLGEVIDSLSQTLLDESKLALNIFSDDHFDASDALFLLGFIDDKRTVKYLAQVLEKYGHDDDWDKTRLCENVVGFLSQNSDESAFEVIKKAMTSPNENIRLKVADAFIWSKWGKNPEAIKLLLKMRNDGYYFVRLRVVQGYKEIESEEATALLREFLKDEHETVRKYAKQYLDERVKNK